MSLRHNLFLLLAGAFVLALMVPLLAPHKSGRLGPVRTGAPPLTVDGQGNAGGDDGALEPLRREASGALGDLRALGELRARTGH